MAPRLSNMLLNWRWEKMNLQPWQVGSVSKKEETLDWTGSNSTVRDLHETGNENPQHLDLTLGCSIIFKEST